MDLEAIAEELYGLRPAEFTAARNRHARAARDAGDRDLAARIRKLRRPTLAAWASNLLSHDPEADRLTSLGEELRRAQRDLDGAQLRELLGQQRRLVAALAGQAARLAAAAGHPVGEHARREVEQTLLAVLVDAEAAQEWAAGRLTHSLHPPSDFARIGQPAPSGGTRRPSRSRRSAQTVPVSDLDQARRRRLERQRQELVQARHAAREADDELQARAEELAAAEAERDQADRAAEAARHRVAELREQLRQAERDERDARDDRQRATSQMQETERSVRAARRRARDTGAAVERLERQASGADRSRRRR